MPNADSEAELVRKVRKAVEVDHGGDYRAAFDFYDDDKDGRINLRELGQLLRAARVGTVWSRTVWGRQVIERLDSDKDGMVSWKEFQAVLDAERPA